MSSRPSTSTSASTSNATPSSSSLSTVVSGLVRAQMGTSLAPTVTDEDLDKHVAELILKEAKKKADTYKQHGVHALVSNRDYTDSTAPRPNKRFLTSIIKSTDDHNKTVLRAQAQAAQEAKNARIAQEKEERRRRAEEAVAARRKVGYGSGGASGSRGESRRKGERERERDGRRGDGDRRDERERDSARRSTRDKGKGREHNRDEGSSRRRSRERDDSRARRHRERSRSRSRSPSKPKAGSSRRERSSRRDDSEGWDRWDGQHARRTGEQRRKVRDWATWNGESDDEVEFRRPQGRSPSPSSRTARSASPPKRSGRKHALDDLSEDEMQRDSPRPSFSKRGRSPSPDATPPAPKRSKHKSSRPRPPSYSPPPTPPPRPRSQSRSHTRATRSPSYRSPSLSSSPSRSRSATPGPLPAPPSKMDKYFSETYDPRLDVAPLTVPTVPATGLVPDAEFDGWDAMLALVRQRQADREERKMLERMGVVVSKDKEKKKGSSTKKRVEDAGKGTKEAAARWGEEVSIMDIEYTKKGAVREWDLGKATPT